MFTVCSHIRTFQTKTADSRTQQSAICNNDLQVYTSVISCCKL